MEADSFTTIVDSIVQSGKHGPYAVVQHPKLGKITVSLNPTAWQEKELPTLGTYIVCWDLRRKRAGWRAEKARFFRPADAISASLSKEQKK